MANIEQCLSDAVWHNEPESWQMKEGVLVLNTSKDTDFWQDTHYGFRRDNGHFLGLQVKGDFTAVLEFEAEYQVLYDQAGLMMRADAHYWLKTGVEYSDQVTNFSTVVTRAGRSDWSVVGVPQLKGAQQIRLTRVGSAVIAHCLGANGCWQLMRLADFPADASVHVGPMACSPTRTGLVVRFSDLQIGPPIEDPLHAI
ncbi:MAG: DUF1349 domain-containing protein [Pseudomonadota bacterium]